MVLFVVYIMYFGTGFFFRSHIHTNNNSWPKRGLCVFVCVCVLVCVCLLVCVSIYFWINKSYVMCSMQCVFIYTRAASVATLADMTEGQRLQLLLETGQPRGVGAQPVCGTGDGRRRHRRRRRRWRHTSTWWWWRIDDDDNCEARRSHRGAYN